MICLTYIELYLHSSPYATILIATYVSLDIPPHHHPPALAAGSPAIVYGYYIDHLNLPFRLSDTVANWDQLLSSIRALEYITLRDNPDDISQRQVGRELRRRGLSISNLADTANDLGLY